jgi:hypothetical protein
LSPMIRHACLDENVTISDRALCPPIGLISFTWRPCPRLWRWVNCDLHLTLMGSSLYRPLGSEIGNGYQRTTSRYLFRNLVEATAPYQHSGDGDRGSLPETCSSPVTARCGTPQEGYSDPLAETKASPSPLRLTHGVKSKN